MTDQIKNFFTQYVGEDVVEITSDVSTNLLNNVSMDMSKEQLYQSAFNAVKDSSLSHLDRKGDKMIQDNAHPIIHPQISLVVYSMIITISLMMIKKIFTKFVQAITINVVHIFVAQVVIGISVMLTAKAMCGKRNIVSDFIASKIIKVVSFKNLRVSVTFIISEGSISFFMFRIICCSFLCGLFFIIHQINIDFGTLSYGMALNVANMIVLRIIDA